MFLKNTMRTVTLLVIFLSLIGCQTDFMGYGGNISTTTPTPEQVQYCRDVMYINPELEIKPIGFFLQPGMDDVIRFKFIANTDDPSLLFDSTHVDSSKFGADLRIYTLNPEATESWWDISSQTLIGGNFLVPPPDSPGTRGLNIGFSNNDDGTLTVFVLWYET